MTAAERVTAASLPAIGVAILDNYRGPSLTPELEPHRVVVTVPRADPQSFAIAYRVAAELMAAIAISAGSNGPLSQLDLPEIERGRAGTCVVVTVPCRDAMQAADVAELAMVSADVAARCTACGGHRERDGYTHRVVRTS